MKPARVMIVEDNTVVARDLRGDLEDLGYEVTCSVTSGEESVLRAEADRPDIVVMDIRLRGKMDGIEAAEQIHARFDIPVVFRSAYSDRQLLDRAKHSGSYGYLLKPGREREIEPTLQIALCKAKAERERRSMEMRMRQMHKLEGLQLMAGGVAHTFNNKLQGVLSCAEMALRRLPPGSEAIRFVKGIQQVATEAAETSNLMLTYVGQNATERNCVNIASLIIEVAANLRNTLPCGASLSLALASGSEEIRISSSDFLQLITALFTNAVEAIGGVTGSIQISTRTETYDADHLKQAFTHDALPAGDYVVLEIRDTGCGMNEETRARAFDPFFTTNFVGRGLGLAAVLGIVRGNSGGIALSSKQEEGTVVTVAFPNVTACATPHREESSTQKPPESITILLADDETPLRESSAEALRLEGHTVVTFEDGEQALEYYRDSWEQIDLVLLDILMPVMHGYEAFRAMREINPDIRALLFSGIWHNNEIDGYLDDGVLGFLQKPFSTGALCAKIAEVQEVPHSTAERPQDELMQV